MFGSSCLYLQLFIARLMSCLRCFTYDVRFVLSLPPVVYSKAHVLFALFSYDVRFVLSLPPVVYSKAHVLFALFSYDVRFVLSLPPVVYSKAHVLFALFSVRCSVRLVFTSRCL